jgi:acyl carrier protein
MPSPTSSVFAELTQVFRDLTSDPALEIAPEQTPDDIPGWDSMTHIAVIVELECRFGVQFRAAEMDSLYSIGELVRAVEAKRARAAA